MKKFWIVIGIISIAVVVTAVYTGWNYVTFVNLKKQCLANFNSGAYPTTIVYLKTGVGADKLKMLSDYVSSLSGVVSIKVITAEQALNEFKVKHSNDRVILDSLNELQSNPLRAYIKIYLTDDADVSLIENNIKLQASEIGIDNVSHQAVREVKKSISDAKFDFIRQGRSERFFQGFPPCAPTFLLQYGSR